MTIVRPGRRFLLGAAVLLLTGAFSLSQSAAVESTPASQPAFNEKEFMAYKQKGHGTLAGQAFLGASSGKAVTQAGAPVHLDRKSTRLNSSHIPLSRMPSSA